MERNIELEKKHIAKRLAYILSGRAQGFSTLTDSDKRRLSLFAEEASHDELLQTFCEEGE